MTNDDEVVEVYLREVANVQPLGLAEEAALFQQVRADNSEDAKRRLIESQLSMVVEIAKKNVGAAGLTLLDLIQEGNCGLMKAVDTFAEHGGDNFSEHAREWVERYIRRAIDDLQRMSRSSLR